MLKLTGCILILFSSVLIFNRKTLENYFTYKLLQTTAEITAKLKYEYNTNRTYKEIFNDLSFDWSEYHMMCQKNRFIDRCELERVCSFFESLGKRDKLSEERYIQYNCEYFSSQKDKYKKLFTDNQKLNCVCGISVGLCAIIFLI